MASKASSVPPMKTWEKQPKMRDDNCYGIAFLPHCAGLGSATFFTAVLNIGCVTHRHCKGNFSTETSRKGQICCPLKRFLFSSSVSQRTMTHAACHETFLKPMGCVPMAMRLP